MRKKWQWKFFVALVVLLLGLTACSSNSTNNKDSKNQTAQKEDISKFPMTVKNDGKIVDGVLKYGLVSDTPFEGTLSYAFYKGQPDAEILQFFDESLFRTNGDYEITNDGAATYELSDDKKTITIKIKDNVKWHDGEPVKAEDLEYAYLVIGHKDYTGVRYGDALIQDIVGMEEYHSGKADKISGIKVIDDKTLTITWKHANPSVLTGIWAYPLPKHYLKDVPIKDLAKSDKIRKNPIGFGPFKVKKIVPGESVEFVRNDDYWDGKPNLKGVILKVVSPQVVLQALKKGEIDIAEFPTDQYVSAKGTKNIQFVGKIDLAYNYIGFKLGHWDAKKQENVMDNPKFQNKKLRQAMAYAINNKEVADRLYHGLRFPATTLIPPSFPGYHDKNAKGYTYDPEKAKKLLDEAGYKDVDGDGFREDPNGKKFTINFLSMSGGDIAEPLAKFYMQCWKDVGLNVQLVDGRLAEFNSFYDMVQNDDPKVDVFAAAWYTGTNVDPYGLYGRDVMFNYSRWVNEKNDELLEKGHSEQAFDKEYRKKIYNEWQALMNEEVPVIPTLYRSIIYAVNNRVKNFTVDPSSKLTWKDVGVTSEKPEVAQ
ncbi:MULTISPECIES: oligopeptide ABC transporter substrate-binding protein [unclassified Geobacillus]|uniref:oligopeptide ABC transporter substrate-binding protein n=1 Tax=unclassified Geobacillus TaxID=2642459 RepID=UPI000BE28632|nr:MULTISPECIES: oligopeptide ABC transporter substrate-binding protein [unclassified Geobacillus]PDM40453.1 oligopeptide ABC transporter substrate-binding protein [Parageobacillus yumthangensis]RDV22209.1 oligopeptide ABC transporter substrate-binding protein [Parageobacillus toebii]TXK91310.1 oligopeptide ABC transporter substrate-binding protein [Parageobacillus sp. SY1]PUF89102.1 oligopeptide ABC transporter substrate-binding protein [Geobacillus sp. LYN3]TXK87514.1 oligopeptide ABC transp